MNTQTFTTWLNSTIQNMELTRRAFADLANVGYQTLHPWRLRDFDPSMITFIRVCHAVAKLTNRPLHVVICEAIQTTKAYKQLGVQNDTDQ
jgi:predicted transcriptional regulator